MALASVDVTKLLHEAIEGARAAGLAFLTLHVVHVVLHPEQHTVDAPLRAIRSLGFTGGWRAMTRRARRSRAVVAGVAAAVALGLGCGSSRPVTIFDRSFDGKTAGVAAGDEFEIDLDSVGPGRFAAPTASSGCVRFLSESESSCSGQCTPGGGKTQRFRFEAVESGRADIDIPFDPTGWTFGMTVLVY